MKEIPLTQGKIALVDDEDFEYLNQWKWCVDIRANTCYALRRGLGFDGKLTTLRMHKAILPTSKGQEIDHINTNGLDNRRINLRVCSHGENQINRSYKSKSGYRGVRKLKSGWQAYITKNNIFIHLGMFQTDVEAAARYNDAALIYHGNFSRLNSTCKKEA